MFHIKTLDVMVWIDIDILCPPHEENKTALTTFERPGDSDNKHNDLRHKFL
jgi:hypothetical protein